MIAAWLVVMLNRFHNRRFRQPISCLQVTFIPPNSVMHDRSCDADYRCIGGNRDPTCARVLIKGAMPSPRLATSGAAYDLLDRKPTAWRDLPGFVFLRPPTTPCLAPKCPGPLRS